MATDVPTVSEVVRRAVGLLDPDDNVAPLGDLERWFEDDDEPVSTVTNLERRVAAATDEIDPDGVNPLVSLAAATVIYLSSSRRTASQPDDTVLRQAARQQWGDDVPADVRAIVDGI